MHLKELLPNTYSIFSFYSSHRSFSLRSARPGQERKQIVAKNWPFSTQACGKSTNLIKYTVSRNSKIGIKTRLSRNI